MRERKGLQDAAIAGRLQREATQAQRRADALRGDAIRRGWSAAEHQVGTEMRLRRGIKRNATNRQTDPDVLISNE